MVSVSEFLSADRDAFLSSTGSFIPREVFIPLEPDDSERFDVLIYEGNFVKEGEIIARSKNICVHSSVPGKVLEILNYQYANGKQGKCARIETSGSFSFTGKKLLEKSWSEFDINTLAFMFKDNGIVNSFSSVEPIVSQMRKIFNKKNKILAVRLFDDDPSREIENYLSKTFINQIVEGAGIVAKTIDADGIVFAFNKKDKSFADYNFDKLLENFDRDVSIFTLPVDIKKYPCGTKHDIVTAAKKFFNEEMLFTFGKDDFFIDSVTALKTYDAFVKGIPSIFEYVHVTGDCLNSAAIMKVRVGTPIKFLAEQCGNFKRPVGKIVVNGIVSGHALPSLDIPVSRDVKSIEFLSKIKISSVNSETCVRCGNCRKICPVHLWPGNLYRLYGERSVDRELLKPSILCSECGLCNSVCPSRIPLCQTISEIKRTF